MSDIEKTSTSGICVSELSQILQDGGALQLAKEMDSNGDGLIDREDFASALKSLQASQKENKSLKKIGYGLLSASLLLAGSTVGASIAAARASNGTTVDNGGVLHAKGTGAIVKTQEALDWSADPDVLGMSTRELIGLKDLVLLNGDVHFQIKGFTKAPSQDEVTFLVEGGTVTFGEDGIVDATGSVIDSYSAVFDSGAGDSGDESQRKLWDSFPFVSGGFCEFECYKEHYNKCGICLYECMDDCPDIPIYVSGTCNGCDDSSYTGLGNDVV